MVTGCGRNAPISEEVSKPIRPGTPPVQSSSVPHLILILPTTNAIDAEILRETMERLSARGPSRFIYREAFVPAGQPPEQQAELISESVRRKVHAMIVAPADPAAIGPSLAEARDQGIAVVTIGPEISGMDRPLPRIDLSPIEPLARRIIEQALKDAKTSLGTASSSPPAIVLKAARKGWRLQDPSPALEAALREAQVPIAATIQHGRSAPESSSSLAEGLAAHPEVRLVLFDSDSGGRAAQSLHHDPKQAARFNFGGFVDQVDPKELPAASALVQRKLQDLGEQAVKTALAQLNKQPVPDQVQVEQSFHAGASDARPGPPRAPQGPRR